jgi:hypothetical protein
MRDGRPLVLVDRLEVLACTAAAPQDFSPAAADRSRCCSSPRRGRTGRPGGCAPPPTPIGTDHRCRQSSTSFPPQQAPARVRWSGSRIWLWMLPWLLRTTTYQAPSPGHQASVHPAVRGSLLGLTVVGLTLRGSACEAQGLWLPGCLGHPGGGRAGSSHPASHPVGPVIAIPLREARIAPVTANPQQGGQHQPSSSSENCSSHS